MAIRVYQYKNCSTCKKALAWLKQNGVEVTVVDITEKPPSKTALKKMWKTSELPLKKFFNTSGKSYREGKFGARIKDMTEVEQLEALAADGKLIKRPLLDTGDAVLVGFRAEAYEALLGE